jgi:hypothetical protein
MMKIISYTLFVLFVLTANYVVADNPATNQHYCVPFKPVTNNLHISSPTITGAASAGGPYALIGKNANVDIIVSGSAEPVTLGKHKEIITFQPSACSCGKKAPGPIISYPEVAPDDYISEWKLNPGNGTGPGKQSFKGTNNVSTPGEYTLKANFTGNRTDCSACSGQKASATDECMVYQLIVTNTPWLGLDRTDGEPNNKTGGAEAFLTPNHNPTYVWTYTGVCMLGNYSDKTVNYSTQNKVDSSSSYLDQKLEVTATISSPESFSLSTSTNFTVVRVDVTVGGVGESAEETEAQESNILPTTRTGHCQAWRKILPIWSLFQ